MEKLAGEYPAGLAKLEAHFEEEGISGDERWRDIQRHIAAGDKGWTRRLLQETRGGGGPAVYGGGGGYTPKCPYGSTWGGPGDYCMNSHIYKCSCAGCPPVTKVTDCRGYGCKQNPPGMQDTCITGGSNGQCNNDAHCPNGQYCSGGYCRNSGGGSGQCRQNYDCPPNNYCSNGWCQSSGGGGGQCYQNNDCPPNNYCQNGRCYYNGGGGGSPLQQFESPKYDYAVQGQNDDIIDRVYSASDCADRCLRTTRYYCASFEYAPAGNRCVLSSGVFPVIYASGWNLYIRN